MKKSIVLSLILLFVQTISSQTMTIDFKDGTTKKYSMNNIEAITFSQDDNSNQGQDEIEGDYVKVTFEGKDYQEPLHYPYYFQLDPVGWAGDTPFTFTYDAVNHFAKEGFKFYFGVIHYSRKADLLKSTPGEYTCVENVMRSNYDNFMFMGQLEIDYHEYDFISGTHNVTLIKDVVGGVLIEGNFIANYDYYGDQKSIKGSYRMTIPD